MPAEVDYKAIKAKFDDGMRRLIHLALSSPELANEPTIVEFREKTAEFDKRVTEIKAQSADILATKERFRLLTLTRDKHLSDFQNAEKKLQALSQQVGEAAFNECLAGRLVEFPALQSRKDIQQKIDDLVKKKSDLDQAEKLGFADRAKKLAESTILAGRITLLKQRIASADKTLGGAVIETHREDEILATNAGDLLSKVCAARTAIDEQAAKLKEAERQLEECRKHAESIGVMNPSTSAFNAVHATSQKQLQDTAIQHFALRREFGSRLISFTEDVLPKPLHALAADLTRLKSKYPVTCAGETITHVKNSLFDELRKNSVPATGVENTYTDDNGSTNPVGGFTPQQNIVDEQFELVDSSKRGVSDTKFGVEDFLIAGALLFCFPIGLLLMWIRAKWHTRTKWIVTGMVCFLLIRSFRPTDKEREHRSTPAVEENVWQETEPERLNEPIVRDDDNEPIVDISAGLTPKTGVRVGPHFSKEELHAVAEPERLNEPIVRDDDNEPIVDIPAGLTPRTGVRVGPHFSKEELYAVAGRFIQNEVRPGWELQRVIELLGKPTKFTRFNNFFGTPQELQEFMDDPLIPPKAKRHAIKETVICTWSFSGDPKNNFIMLAFDENERLQGGDTFITFALPKVSTRELADEKTTKPSPLGQPTKAETSRRSFEGSKAGEAKELNGIRFRWCPAGSFTMGSPKTELDRANNEDQVNVTLSNGFWLGETELTQGQWQKLMGTTPWSGEKYVKEGSDYPATNISHHEAVSYCQKLTIQERSANRLPEGWKYSLPTEAQWEYACRAGTKTKYSFGDDESQLGEYAWFDKNACDIGEKYAHQVGTKNSNPWGLHDMHGNVWEWCSDWYFSELWGGRDPVGVGTGWNRVIRGGCWFFFAARCRAAARDDHSPGVRGNFLGFRLALVRE